ncbi:MAG: NADP-dependent oxidoreductase [Halioglobus sp.]|nr:NADP-dependent oxidoreductase [Halioglobus sp.]
MTDERSNQQFLLAARPSGEIQPSDFELVDAGMPTPGDGEFLVEVHYLAVEPAMKGWMEARVDYVAPLEIGDVMRGQGSGIVIESNNDAFPVGTAVAGHLGWRRYLATDGQNPPLRKLPEGVSLKQGLNVLGITGLTAYFGMLDIGEPREGDTVLVSGAAGATGSVAGQLARERGARVVGIAGGSRKCEWLVDELGFEAAIDYKSEDTAARVRELCPRGVDVYFDNVGGEILDIALDNLAERARVVLCGGISRYNQTGPLPGPVNYFNLIYRRARMEGFIVIDYAERFGEATARLSQMLSEGTLRSRETVLQGFDRLPEALIGIFHGDNIGKQMVEVDR